jgi:hypothetical protein
MKLGCMRARTRRSWSPGKVFACQPSRRGPIWSLLGVTRARWRGARLGGEREARHGRLHSSDLRKMIEDSQNLIRQMQARDWS